jgi:hypothetical protein
MFERSRPLNLFSRTQILVSLLSSNSCYLSFDLMDLEQVCLIRTSCVIHSERDLPRTPCILGIFSNSDLNYSLNKIYSSPSWHSSSRCTPCRYFPHRVFNNSVSPELDMEFFFAHSHRLNAPLAELYKVLSNSGSI